MLPNIFFLFIEYIGGFLFCQASMRGAFAPSAHQVSSSDGSCQILSIAAATPSSLQLRKCCAGFGGQFFFVVQKRSVQIERSKAVLHQFFSSRSIETPRPKEPGVMHVRIAIAFPVCMLL